MISLLEIVWFLWTSKLQMKRVSKMFVKNPGNYLEMGLQTKLVSKNFLPPKNHSMC